MAPTQLIMDVVTKREGGYFAKKTAKCPEAVAKNHMPVTYPLDWKNAPSKFLVHLLTSGITFEEEIFTEMGKVAKPGTFRLITEQVNEIGGRTEEGKTQVERDTFEAMRDPKVRIIAGGRIGAEFEKLLDSSRGGPGKELAPWHISQPDVIVTSGKFDKYGNPTFLTVMDVKDHNALSGEAKAVRHLTAEFKDLTQPIAVTAKGAVRIDDCDQLAHYTRHLEAIGLASDEKIGWIIGRERKAVATDLTAKRFTNPEDKTLPRMSALEHYDYWTTFGRKVVENAQARDLNPNIAAITTPERKPACDDCEWRTVCNEELHAHGDGGHITLLPGISPERARAHYAAGVTSIRDLARLDPVTASVVETTGSMSGLQVFDPKTAKYVSGPKPYKLTNSIWQARTVSAGRVCRAVGVTTVDLQRADIEIDFDLENSAGPLPDIDREERTHHGSALVYLWGTRMTKRKRMADESIRTTIRDKQFHSFTDTDEGEARAFSEFWTYLTASRQRAIDSNLSWRAYHYTGHELHWMRTLAKRHAGKPGVPTLNDIEQLLATGDVVDLYKILTTQLVWPTESHTIKALAKWARFSWRADDAGGDSSMVWYTESVLGDSKSRRVNRRRLLDYNVDDVAAQLHLRDWIESLQSAEESAKRIPAVNTLRGPLPKRS